MCLRRAGTFSISRVSRGVSIARPVRSETSASWRAVITIRTKPRIFPSMKQYSPPPPSRSPGGLARGHHDPHQATYFSVDEPVFSATLAARAHNQGTIFLIRPLHEIPGAFLLDNMSIVINGLHMCPSLLSSRSLPLNNEEFHS